MQSPCKANVSAKKREIIDRLSVTYNGAKPALEFTNAFELLVATILSAQCTDARVNMVTRELFPKYPDAHTLSSADVEDVKKIVHPCGCYQVKANNLVKTASIICEKFGGEVPSTLDDLTTLPGVGRKTANVVLSNAFGIPGLAVDTHVLRVANRTGLVKAPGDPEKTEKQLCALIKKDRWGEAHHWLIYHGRQICSARSPKCAECPLEDVCAKKDINTTKKQGAAK